jgi:hypothetical protein
MPMGESQTKTGNSAICCDKSKNYRFVRREIFNFSGTWALFWAIEELGGKREGARIRAYHVTPA